MPDLASLRPDKKASGRRPGPPTVVATATEDGDPASSKMICAIGMLIFSVLDAGFHRHDEKRIYIINLIKRIYPNPTQEGFIKF
jgi:hypothetical protein